MAKKKEDSVKNEFDLNQPVIGIDGGAEPIQDRYSIMQFQKPVEVSWDRGSKSETASALVLDSVTLTYRKLILKALRGESQKESKVDIERSTDLMLKCMADKVELDSDERSDINKCVKELNDPLLLLRIKQLWGDV